MAGCFSSSSFNCRSFTSRTDIITSDASRGDSIRSAISRSDLAGATAAGATATGAITAGLTAAGAAATGLTTAGAAASAVCGVTAFSGTVSVAVVAVLAGCSTTAWENVFVAGSDRVGELSGWFSFCINAARAAAWAGVSAARTEMKSELGTMHKLKAILIFMKFPIFIPFCEHPQGQISLLPAAKQFFCLRANVCLRSLRAGENSVFRESSSFESQ